MCDTDFGFFVGSPPSLEKQLDLLYPAVSMWSDLLLARLRDGLDQTDDCSLVRLAGWLAELCWCQ